MDRKKLIGIVLSQGRNSLGALKKSVATYKSQLKRYNAQP